MTKAALASELVRRMYSNFTTDTLREMAEQGKKLLESGLQPEHAEIFQAALEREIERRELQ